MLIIDLALTYLLVSREPFRRRDLMFKFDHDPKLNQNP